MNTYNVVQYGHWDESEGEDTVKFILSVCPKKLGGCYIQDKYKGSFLKRKRNEKVISTMGRGRGRGWKTVEGFPERGDSCTDPSGNLSPCSA